MASAALALGLVALAGAAGAGMVGAASTPTRVSEGPRGGYEASLAPSDDGFAVAWYDTRHASPEIYARLLDAEGRAVGDELRLTHSAARSYEPSLTVARRDDGRGPVLVVGWYDVAPDGSSSRARIGAWTAAGGLLWERTLSDPSRRGRIPAVALDSDVIHCVWLEHDGDAGDRGPAQVWRQHFRLDGSAPEPARPIAPASRDTWNLDLVVDADGAAWVVFDAHADTRAKELFLTRDDGTATTVTRLTADDGVPSTYPDLSLADDGRAALTWFDTQHGNEEVYLYVGASETLSDDDEMERTARRVTRTAGASIGAYLTWNGEAFGLAWCDEGEPGRPHELFFQPFDPAGAPLAAPTQLTDNPTASLIPAIRPAGTRFALVWNEDVVEERGDHVTGGRSDVVFALVP